MITTFGWVSCFDSAHPGVKGRCNVIPRGRSGSRDAGRTQAHPSPGGASNQVSCSFPWRRPGGAGPRKRLQPVGPTPLVVEAGGRPDFSGSCVRVCSVSQRTGETTARCRSPSGGLDRDVAIRNDRVADGFASQVASSDVACGRSPLSLGREVALELEAPRPGCRADVGLPDALADAGPLHRSRKRSEGQARHSRV